VEVTSQFGGTGSLLSQLKAVRKGDLLIAADEGAVGDARKAELIGDVFAVAVQHPVIAVRKNNPKNIKTLDDLLRSDVKLALANPEAASISRVSRTALGDTWKKLAAHAAVTKPTVTEIAADVNLGTADAGIIWDAVVAQFKNVQAVEVPELASHKENASVCVLSFSEQPAMAVRFAHYLAAPDKGGPIFQESGFTPAGGEKWSASAALEPAVGRYFPQVFATTMINNRRGVGSWIPARRVNLRKDG
jgi:molybdate transport system substrate-binding protein